MNDQLRKNLILKFVRGFSYTEILITIFLIAVALVPVLESMQTAQLGAGVQQSLSTQHYHLTAKVEEVLAQPFGALAAAATAAGSPTTATIFSDASGTINRRLVFIAEYDGDNADADDNPFTGTDFGLLWLRVEIENTAQQYETLISL